MKNTYTTSGYYHIKDSKVFTERDIIQLQDVFLTHGFHTITVASVDQGRSLISKFIQALNYYKHIACLTTLVMPHDLDINVFNVFKVLNSYGDITNQAIFDFLLEYFYADFLVVEMSPELMMTPWFYNFEQQLLDFKIDTLMPIIYLSYSKTG